MNKGASLGIGLGLISLLGGLYYVGIMEKEDIKQVDPAMEAGYKGSNAANILSMNTARSLYVQAKGKAPEHVEDLVPEFLPSVPAEAFSKSNKVVSAYDGSGGWVLTADGFQPNFPQSLNGGSQ
jgi:hypothetical protein